MNSSREKNPCITEKKAQKKYQLNIPINYNHKLIVQQSDMGSTSACSESKSSQSFSSISSFSQSSKRSSYKYVQLEQTLRNFLESNEIILSFQLYESPLEYVEKTNQDILKQVLRQTQDSNEISLSTQMKYRFQTVKGKGAIAIGVYHHQIIFKFRSCLLLLSWGQDGLKRPLSFNHEQLINKRKQNIKINEWNGPFQLRKLKKFLNQNQQKKYNVMFWNCQHFCKELIKLFVDNDQGLLREE